MIKAIIVIAIEIAFEIVIEIAFKIAIEIVIEIAIVIVITLPFCPASKKKSEKIKPTGFGATNQFKMLCKIVKKQMAQHHYKWVFFNYFYKNC